MSLNNSPATAATEHVDVGLLARDSGEVYGGPVLNPAPLTDKITRQRRIRALRREIQFSDLRHAAISLRSMLKVSALLFANLCVCAVAVVVQSEPPGLRKPAP